MLLNVNYHDIYIHTHMYTHTYTHIYIYTHTHTHIYIYTHTHIYIYFVSLWTDPNIKVLPAHKEIKFSNME